MGLELFSPDEDRSAVVHGDSRARTGSTRRDLVRGLRDRFGITIANGQSTLKGKIFRIGHIGYFDVFDITTALAAVELVLADLGAEIERGVAVTRGARGVRRARPRVKRVLIAESIADAGVELLRERFEVDVEAERRPGRADRRLRRDRDPLGDEADGRGARARRPPEGDRPGRVGVDNVDVEAATRRGIVVANAPESTVVSAAEHTIGLLLALSRNIPQAHAALKEGRWERGRYGGIELEARRSACSASAGSASRSRDARSGCGMRVVAYDPFVVARSASASSASSASRRPKTSTGQPTS